MSVNYGEVQLPVRSQLLCPICGLQYAHCKIIEIFNRVEDKNEGNRVVVEGFSAFISRSMEGNPSQRRSGVKLLFEGECGHNFYLNIYEHEGENFIDIKPYEVK